MTPPSERRCAFIYPDGDVCGNIESGIRTDSRFCNPHALPAPVQCKYPESHHAFVPPSEVRK